RCGPDQSRFRYASTTSHVHATARAFRRGNDRQAPTEPTNQHGRPPMRSLTRVLVAAVLVSSPAFAQARPATTATKTASDPATEGDFTTGPFYAGPRIWIGNLNGAVAFGGQIEKGFTPAGKYGPGIISGGLGL